MRKTNKLGRAVKNKESKFLGLADVLSLIPLSRSSIYRMIDLGTFPKCKKIGERAVVWSKEEIEKWIEKKLK